jgi:predicted alpha/beta hydrolase family esterase
MPVDRPSASRVRETSRQTNVVARTLELSDGTETFAASVFEAENPRCVGLFAVGRGGNPLRHAALLQTLAAHGCTMIAPHFAMLDSPFPTKALLDRRIRRLDLAAENAARSDRPLIGIGHSIGCVALLVLAGAVARTVTGEQSIGGSSGRAFEALALLAPATDFFRHPQALSAVDTRLYIRVGAKDSITPPAQAADLHERLAPRLAVELHPDAQAGHFTYMDELPPGIVDPQPDRAAFLSRMGEEIAAFVTAAC